MLAPFSFMGGAIDPDAQAFINAAGITDPVQINAINTLVLNMKTQGLWSKMKAVYPFVTDNRNLLGYTEDFGNAAWFKQSTTVTTNTSTAPNGTLTADTALFSSSTPSFVRASTIPITSGQTYTISVYVKKSASSGANNIRITTNDTLAWNTGITQKFSLTTSWQRITLTGVINSSVNVAHIIFGSTNLDGTVDATCGGNVDMWGAQLELGSTATSYQPIATTQQAFISNQFKYNLVNPVDSDAAFRLVFNGGWTHSAQGATPNGTNGYADTNLVPSSVLAQNSASLSLYSRTNNTSLIDRVEMGSSNVTVDIQQAIRWNGTLGNLSRLNNGYIVGTSGYIPTKTSGLFAVSRTSSTITKKYEDGILKETTADPSATPNSFSIYLATRNNSGTAAFFDAKQYAFATIGDGLTDTEAANLYTAVQTFQTTLNRQV